MNLVKLFGRWWQGRADLGDDAASAPGKPLAPLEASSAVEAPSPSPAGCLPADEQAGDTFLGYLG